MDRKRALIAILVVAGLILVALFAASLTRGGPAEDRLSDEQVTAPAERKTDPAARCGDRATYELIKRELFRQAAAIRGSDQATYARLADFAVTRVEAPLLKRSDETARTWVCTARVSLDMPPGVAVADGRTTLTTDLDYAIQAEGDGTGEIVTLSGAEGITVPLATLTRTGAIPGLPEGQEPGNEDQPQPLPRDPLAPEPGQLQPVAPEEPPPMPVQSSARPSFDCADARIRGEIAVCNDAGLAELDRFMASKYVSAIRNGDPTQRALLERTRGSFLVFRDRCRSNSCIAGAYRGRMREIDDIMAGRWTPPR